MKIIKTAAYSRHDKQSPDLVSPISSREARESNLHPTSGEPFSVQGRRFQMIQAKPFSSIAEYVDLDTNQRVTSEELDHLFYLNGGVTDEKKMKQDINP